jgi:peptidoglycan/xylan/chitin deacetylase (PgdA/CDA1 family)
MAEALVALTIDDLPWHAPVSYDRQRRGLASLVHRLVAAEARATGFVNGGRRHLAEARLWLDAGFPLGNHTYSHVALSRCSPEAFIDDIARNERVVLETLGYDLRAGWFRYPYLDHAGHARKRAAVTQFLREHQYTHAPVSINTADYAFARQAAGVGLTRAFVEAYLAHVLDCAGYFRRLGEALYGRDIPHVLLLHANELNACCIDELVHRLRTEGYQFVDLSVALADPVYRPFGAAPPVGRAGSRGDFLGDIARARGVATDPDPSCVRATRPSTCRC